MEKNVKFTTSVLMVACVVFLIISVALFFMRQTEIEKRVALEKNIEELNKEKSRLTNELDDVTLVKKDLEIKLNGIQEKVKLVEGQLEDEKRSKESLFAQFEAEKNESKRIVDELMKLKDEKELISVELVNIKGECSALKTQLYSVQQAKEVLESKLKDMLAKSEVELEKIVVKPEAAIDVQENAVVSNETIVSTPVVDKQGEVLVVNKKFDFVVVNLGETDGLMPGMSLGVYRNRQLLGTLKVEKVHASMSAAKIPPEWKNADIKEGDVVVVMK